MDFPAYAKIVSDRLWAAGYEAYFVGGCLRDRLMGNQAHDFDMTTSATPEQMLGVFADFRTIPTGLSHGTLTVLSEGHPIEVTTFRVDGSYSDSRHPDQVTFTRNLCEDLARRDFTVNAMAYSERTGLCDPFGGQQDLHNRILRAVGEPSLRFTEDALRIMRAFRFSAQLNFSIEAQTLSGILHTRAGLSQIARERIGVEMMRLLSSLSPERALRQMEECLVFPFVWGEGCDVIRDGLDAIPADPCLRLGALLRDTDEERRVAALNGLRLSGEQKKRALLCASVLHERLQGDEIAARRLMARCGADTLAILDAALVLGIADKDFADCVCQNVERGVPVSVRELALSGADLMKLGVVGKQVGSMLNVLLELVMDSPELNQKEILLAFAEKHIKEKESEHNE